MPEARIERRNLPIMKVAHIFLTVDCVIRNEERFLVGKQLNILLWGNFV
jgi:hypothetical protein